MTGVFFVRIKKKGSPSAFFVLFVLSPSSTRRDNSGRKECTSPLITCSWPAEEIYLREERHVHTKISLSVICVVFCFALLCFGLSSKKKKIQGCFHHATACFTRSPFARAGRTIRKREGRCSSTSPFSVATRQVTRKIYVEETDGTMHSQYPSGLLPVKNVEKDGGKAGNAAQ